MGTSWTVADKKYGSPAGLPRPYFHDKERKKSCAPTLGSDMEWVSDWQDDFPAYSAGCVSDFHRIPLCPGDTPGHTLSVNFGHNITSSIIQIFPPVSTNFFTTFGVFLRLCGEMDRSLCIPHRNGGTKLWRNSGIWLRYLKYKKLGGAQRKRLGSRWRIGKAVCTQNVTLT